MNKMNLLFHMMGVLLFALFLSFIQHFDQYPFRFIVIGLILVIMASSGSYSSSKLDRFSESYRRVKQRMAEREASRKKKEDDN